MPGLGPRGERKEEQNLEGKRELHKIGDLGSSRQAGRNWEINALLLPHLSTLLGFPIH